MIYRFNISERRSKPSMILDYNKYIGCLDIMDQSRAYYGVGRKANKYWKCILYNGFNITVINSFIVYNKNNF